MSKKIVFTILILTTLAMVLAACGSAATQSSGTTPASSAGTSTSIDAKALIESNCTTCHSLDRITSAHKTETQWSDTVDRMIGRSSITFTADEKAAVIQYLAANYK
jgi:hypothetical protein